MVGEVLTNIGKMATKTVEKTTEVREVALQEVFKTGQVLQPDLEVIKTQSLESVIQDNIEKTVEVTEEISTELQPISEELAEKLKEEGILSDNAIEALHIDTTGNLVLKCINEKLTGEAHEITGVPYVEKTIQVGSEKIKVTVPEFPFKIAIEVPKELWKSGDVHIFKYCTKELRNEIKTNPEMIKQYTPQQLEQIMNGDAYIKGLTWHHSEVPGRMELVPTRIHALSNHTGGNTIWCGGIR